MGIAIDRNMGWAVTDQTIDVSTTQGKPVVVAIDDDEDNLLLLRYTLDQLNCTVVCLTDSRLALPLIKANPPDLILLDILIPELSGFDVIKFIQADVALRQIPVIAVTALASIEDQERILAAGFTDYLVKPFWLDTLLTMVRDYLGLEPYL